MRLLSLCLTLCKRNNPYCEARYTSHSLHTISEYNVYTRSHFGMDTLCFHLLTLSGAQLDFDGGSNTTVWQLKGLIKKRLGVPRRMQKLFDGTCELGNQANLPGVERPLTLALVHSSACRVCEDCSLRFCSGCFSACYCSEECQIKDWTIHRHHCGHIKLNSFSPVFPTHHRSCLQPFCFYSLGFW